MESMTAGTLPQVNLCIHCKSKPLWESIEVHARHGTKPCTLKDSYVKQNYLEFGIPYLPHFLARDAKPERIRGYLEKIKSPLLPFKFDDGECVVVEDYDSEFWDFYEPEYHQDDAIRDLEKTRWGPIEEAAVSVIAHRSPVTGVVKYFREVSESVTETDLERSNDVPYIVSRGPRETELACVSTSQCYQTKTFLVDSSELVTGFRETSLVLEVRNVRVSERIRGFLRIKGPSFPFRFDDGDCVIVADYGTKFWDSREPECHQGAVRSLGKTQRVPVEQSIVRGVARPSSITRVINHSREVSELVTETKLERSNDVPCIVSCDSRETEAVCVGTSRNYQAQCLVDHSELVPEFRETNPVTGVRDARVTERKPSRVSGWYKRYRFRRTDSWKG